MKGIAAVAMMTMGCTPVPPAGPVEEEVPVHGSTGRRCEAARAQGLVGREATSELGAEAMRLTGAGMLRWLRPDYVVTMEYREDRLNIELDARNRVRALRCG
jgi:hypothetical protein